MTPAFWTGRRVLVTGHTGFKGSWLCCWLDRLGAEVTGLAHDPETAPNLWQGLGLASVDDRRGDVCDTALLDALLAERSPEIVLHLAAQSLVRRSYREPVETFRSNVMGVVALLQSVARCPSVRAVVIVTSDKCYRNVEQIWGYRETDPMGGHDPYSASKGCAELATAAMRSSFFAPYAAGGHDGRVASARAGNVIGGGDWSEDRLVPDIVRGCLGSERRAGIRNPDAVRPWQHVLEPLRGYLMLAEALCEGVAGADDGWNFGPDRSDERPVRELAEAVQMALGSGTLDYPAQHSAPHEATLLQLDSTKARRLGWRPRLDFASTVAMTADWYGGWAKGAQAAALCVGQIESYMELCEDV